MVYARLHHPLRGTLLDNAMIVRFKAPRSFTGGDIVELHVHGGPAVVSAVLEALAALPYLRQAGPGDFIRTAFLSGKLDLTEVEGVADLLAAETEQQRALALQNASGALRSVAYGWRQRLLRCLARLEAVIDFGEDENLSEDVAAAAHLDVAALAADMRSFLASGVRGELIRDGVGVAIVGPPNVGKSSLLNCLAQRDAAIVSPTPGTTRDVLSVALDVGGYKVTLMDTAGLREGEGDIEQEGIRRAVDAARNASIVILMLDATAVFVPEPRPSARKLLRPQAESAYQSGDSLWPKHVDALLRQALRASDRTGPAPAAAPLGEGESSHSSTCAEAAHERLPSSGQPFGAVDYLGSSANSLSQAGGASDGGDGDDAPRAQQLIVVYNKADLLDTDAVDSVRRLSASSGPGLRFAGLLVSVQAGHNLQQLMDELGAAVDRVMQADGSSRRDGTQAMFTRQRQRLSLQECLACLERYPQVMHQHELAAEELRAAAHALGKLTGEINPEAVLDMLFAEFCIGK